MRIEVVCSHCGSQFTKRSDHLRPTNFCNRTCQGLARRVAEPKWPRRGEPQTLAAKEYLREYNERNREAQRARSAAWSKRNAEKRSAIAAGWRSRNRDQISASSQIRRAAGTLTAAEHRLLIEKAAGRCVYCGEASQRLQMDHVAPVKKGGRSEIDNLLPVCVSCNASKGAKEAEDWLHEKHGIMGLARAVWFLENREIRLDLYEAQS